MPKLSVELPQGLIDDLDRNKSNYCRDLGVPIGIGQKAVSQKLKKPKNIKIHEFLAICELIEEQPESFFVC